MIGVSRFGRVKWIFYLNRRNLFFMGEKTLSSDMLIL